MVDQQGLKTLRNIETDFNEIARSDERADLKILRQYSHELITSKIFKAVMLVVIILNTILMIAPIQLESGKKGLAEDSRIPLSIVENIIGTLVFKDIIN